MSLHPSGRLNLDTAQLQRMLADIPFAVAVYEGAEHLAVFSNAMHDEITGGRIRLGVPILQSLPELAGQPAMQTLDAVYATGKTQREAEMPVQLMRKGRLEDCWFEVTWQPVSDASGGVIGVMAIAIEVSQHVRNRQLIERARADAQKLAMAAKESERHFRELVDNLPELAWSADAEGNIGFYNRRWYEYTGTTFDQMKGWGWQSVHDPEHLASVVVRWKHSLATGEAFEMEFPLRRADGIFRWFLTRVVPFRNDAGEIVRWFGTNTDIDDQRRMRGTDDRVTRAQHEA